MAPPEINPTNIQVKSIILWSASVTKTARSIPVEDKRLPLLAVSGDPSIFNPTIKRIEAAI